MTGHQGKPKLDMLAAKQGKLCDSIGKPLHILDLPLDVLKSVLKEVPNANDLTALALTHSTLHGLCVPIMYSRFDIVWPDAHLNTEPRTGVDALTYGLATLVMREDIFENAMLAKSSPNHGTCQSYACKGCGHINYVNKHGCGTTGRLRRGNFFSQFVKSFSLGNGPPDMVGEYVVTKEGGKMLGTLVALSVARMPNLQTFIWDMPTGILRDVWISLSSLGDYQPSALQKVSIRFHNNRKAMEETELVRSGTTNQTPSNPSAASQMSSQPSSMDTLYSKFVVSNHYVESPNFSILPPLRSLSAIAIDELANLNELSLLIGKSVDKLRELRVGMASELHTSGLPPDSRAMKYLCKGGAHVKVHEDGKSLLFEPFIEHSNGSVTNGSEQVISMSEFAYNQTSRSVDATLSVLESKFEKESGTEVDITHIDPALASNDTSTLDSEDHTLQIQPSNDPPENPTIATPTPHSESKPTPGALQNGGDGRGKVVEDNVFSKEGATAQGPQKLQLEILELERHTINIKLLSDAIDWSILTSLTLLCCVDADALWQTFRTWYAPVTRPNSLIVSIPTKFLDKKSPTQSRLRRMPSSPRPVEHETTYRLHLKRIHTNSVSTKLLTFLKETLAPNSLEWLFLQDCPEYQSGVNISQIYKGPLKRHKGSLTKLLINSSHGGPSSRARALSAKKWMLNREILGYITAPKKMPKLRELSVSLEYKDWHSFIQQLPNIKGLRSLHIPFLVEHVYGHNFSVRDVAMGIVDVINLRKECELAYLGIGEKCFEIVETAVRPRRKHGTTSASNTSADGESSDDDLTPHVSDSDDGDEDSDDDGAVVAAPASNTATPNEEDDMGDDDVVSSEEEEDLSTGKQVKMKLREILFYDDKISIFKARHGKL